MKFLSKIILCTMLALLFCSCNLWSLFSHEHAEDTKVKKITNKFSLSDKLVYITYHNPKPSYSTFVIDSEKMEIISRIDYSDGRYEFGALQVTPYKDRLWLLGTTNACKILIFNPETGKTEETISFTEWNSHRMNFLPTINKVAVMHGNRYDKGCSVSLINLATHKYEGLAYIQQIAPQLEDINGKIYGSGNYFEPRTERGFGTYTLEGDTFVFNKEFSLSPATDSVQTESVIINKFLVLEDGTYIVCDNTIGLKILYPDSSEGKIWYGEEEDDYREVENIYYSKELDRIYVEGGKGYLLSYLEKNTDGKWERSENFIECTEHLRGLAAMLNGNTWVLTYESEDYETFIVRFYDITDMTLKKEIHWNVVDDSTAIVYP